MPAEAWVDTRIQYDEEPDTVRGQPRLNGVIAPRWSHIKFRREDVLQLWPTPSQVSAAPVDTQELTGGPGRPSKGVELYMAEFQRRIEAGVMEPEPIEEAKELHRWFAETHPNRQAPTRGTIRNRIRAEHRRQRERTITI